MVKHPHQLCYPEKLFRRVDVFGFLLLLISICFHSKTAHSQETSQNSLEFSPEMALRYFPAANNISGNSFGGEFIYHMALDERSKDWQKKLKLNSTDLIFRYNSFQQLKINDLANQFANSYALLYGLNISILKYRFLQINLSPGFGIGYTGKTIYTNDNKIIGSHFNMYSRAALKAEIQLSTATKLSGGINFLHFSNGGTRVPNVGLNASSLSFGVISYLKRKSLKKSTPNVDNIKDTIATHEFEFGANIGRRGVYRSTDGLYKSGFYTGYNYRLNPLLGFAVGLDAVYYHTIYDPARNLETYQSNATSFDHWKLGTAIGPDFYLGRSVLSLKYGYYLYYNSLKPINTYWTAGYKYHLYKSISLQSRLYIHQVEADYLGFGVVVNLLRIK